MRSTNTEHDATVRYKSRVAPHVVRVGFTAASFLTSVLDLPAIWARVWFPDPCDPLVEHQRGYTVINPDYRAGTFEIDFALHSPSGPGSTWASNAKPGDSLKIVDAGTHHFELDPDAGALVLIGDSASIPAINQVLKRIPDKLEVRILIDVHRIEDIAIPIHHGTNAMLHWLPNQNNQVVTALEDTLADWRNIHQVQVWGANERNTSLRLRQSLKKYNTNLPLCQGYWAKGHPMGHSRSVLRSHPTCQNNLG